MGTEYIVKVAAAGAAEAAEALNKVAVAEQ